MKKLFWLLLIALPLFLGATEHEVTVRIKRRSEVEKISRISSVYNVKDHQVWINATDEELAELRQMGYHPVLLPSRAPLVRDAMSADLDVLRDWDTYPTYEAYVDLMNQFATDYPDLCEVFSIGQTVDGRELLVARISDNIGIQENEPELFYTGTMHGDETTGFVLLLRLIDFLLSNYGIDPMATELVNGSEIFINPAANPDGTYAGGNASVNGATRRNGNNVDLNRNFPDPEDGPHPDGEEWQPETLAMMDFAQNHSITLSANFHGGAEVVNYPWDTWPRLHADDQWYQYLSHTYADLAHANSPAGYMAGFNNGITNGFQWYTTSGCRQDWMNYFGHAREVTIELSATKLLPPSQLPTYWDYNKDALLAYLQQGLYGVNGIVTSTDGTPLPATVTVIDHDIDNAEIWCDPDLGDYHRMLTPGTYTLAYSCYGYGTVEHQVTVTQDAVVTRDAVLTAVAAYPLAGVVQDATTLLPIPGANVELTPSPFSRIITADDGAFVFDGVYEGDYFLDVSAEGFVATQVSVTVDASTQPQIIELTPTNAISFENGEISADWQMSGAADWTLSEVTAYDGFFSLRSGVIGDNQMTSVSISVDVIQASDLVFYRKVSSESGYDKLTFFADDVQISQWSGDSDWVEETYAATVGNHTFRWEYAKDQNTAGGADCGWIDFITLPATSGNGADPPVVPQGLASLDAVYPNPFKASGCGRSSGTTISYTVGQECYVDLGIYNIRGQKIANLVQEKIPAGQYSIQWNGKSENGSEVASGLYFAHFTTGDVSNSKKIILLK